MGEGGGRGAGGGASPINIIGHHLVSTPRALQDHLPPEIEWGGAAGPLSPHLPPQPPRSSARHAVP